MALAAPILCGVWGLAAMILIYPIFICLLIIPAFQNQAIYLNAFKMTWNQDLTVPEQFGFLRNQVTPFWLTTTDAKRILAWHILPLQLYLQHERELRNSPTGVVDEIMKTLSFRLLQEDPEAQLVLYFHGAAGTLGSGYRPLSYHAISAGSVKPLHIIAIDYRGFGMSEGKPSETGLFTDAMTLVDFLLEKVKIPSSRMVLFGQSLGTAVSIAVAKHLASQSPAILFSGMVLVAPFVDVETLTATYRIAGTIPILDPLARFPRLMNYLNSFILSKWNSKDNLKEFIRSVENREEGNARYHVSLIHAQDDYDIPFHHSELLFEHAVSATVQGNVTVEDIQKNIQGSRKMFGAGGSSSICESRYGSISLDILQYGLHDKIMGYPIVSRSIAKAFSG